MKFIKILSILLCIILWSCANQKPANGGPEDKTPPKLISSIPKNGVTNFKENSITLVFDERIEENNFKKNFFIIPSTELDYKYSINGKELTISWYYNLEVNTTYTFMLSNAIKDVTKQNQLKNLKFVFSTGINIDSLKVVGECTNTLTNKPNENFLVGLYKSLEDSVNINKTKPLYFSYTDKSGKFNIDYLPNKEFQIFTFKDENNNLLWDKNEEIGFYNKTIKSTDSSSIKLTTFVNDITPPIVESKTIQNNICEIKINEPLEKVELLNKDLVYTFDSLKTIMIYFDKKDSSTKTEILVTDLSKNTDTISIDLVNKNTSKARNIVLSRTTDYYKNEIFLKSNFIIDSINTDSIIINSDSEILKDLNYKFDYNNLIISNISEKDSNISIKIRPQALYSINREVCSNQQLIKLERFKPEKHGSISGTINNKGQFQNYVVELLYNGAKVSSLKNITEFNYKDMKPGNYTMQIKIDMNNNGRFDLGNLEKREQPDKIFIHKDIINLLPNWDIEGIIINLD